MLSSSSLSDNVDVFLVDERMDSSRAVFGASSKKSIVKEAKRCIRIWNDLRRTIVTNNVNVVHANIPAFTLSMMREIGCALIAKHYGAKFVIHFRCTVPTAANSKISRAVLKVLLGQSSASIVLNEKSKQFVSGLSDLPTRLIPNFVSDELLAAEKFDLRQSKFGDFVVTYAGGLIEEKGVYDILEAAKQLPGVTFLLAGAGDLTEQEITTSNVLLLGSLEKEELYEVYRQSDVFLFLTRYRGEGFSNSLVEAMAHSLPCVVSDWAANRDMVGKYETLVVNPSESDQVVAAIRSLFRDDFRHEVGSYNQERVRTLYSESVVVEQYIKLYRDLVKDEYC